MKINYNTTGPKRKKLVQAISEIIECEAKYNGAPSFDYQIDYFTVDRNGTLIFDDRADSEEIEQLIEALMERGFEAEVETETSVLSIAYPKDKLGEDGLANLKKYVEAKRDLFCEAFRTDELPIEVDEEKVSFPWFDGGSTSEQVHAYSTFVCKLCEMMANAKRVTASAKPIDSKKYAMRCILLRIGLIGDEYKQDRKILLHNFKGSSAFKSGKKKGYSEVMEELKSILNTDYNDDDEPIIRTEIVAKLENPEKAVCR